MYYGPLGYILGVLFSAHSKRKKKKGIKWAVILQSLNVVTRCQIVQPCPPLSAVEAKPASRTIRSTEIVKAAISLPEKPPTTRSSRSLNISYIYHLRFPRQ